MNVGNFAYFLGFGGEFAIIVSTHSMTVTSVMRRKAMGSNGMCMWWGVDMGCLSTIDILIA